MGLAICLGGPITIKTGIASYLYLPGPCSIDTVLYLISFLPGYKAIPPRGDSSLIPATIVSAWQEKNLLVSLHARFSTLASSTAKQQQRVFTQGLRPYLVLGTF